MTLVLMVIFALWLGWLPASGMFAPYGGGGLQDLLVHLALPAVTLAAASVTIIARLTRSTMLETPGPVLSLASGPEGASVTAVIWNLSTGDYEVHRFALACRN